MTSSFQRIHGGPDQHGTPLFDFSTNSNACGPCPQALAAIGQADPTQYPDAGYTALRGQLAAFHDVDVRRVVLAASASEFIFRISSLAAQRGARAVSLPPHSYGDYAQAARAHRLALVAQTDEAQLRWACEPSSPLGVAYEGLRSLPGRAASAMLVLDRAYEPLRLDGAAALTHAQLQSVWQLWTPNKALGLTGVRAAYAIAPLGSDADAQAMEALCPSWPVGSHGVAMLQAWTSPDVRGWLAESLNTLREWKKRQIALLESSGWICEPSDANFFCARPPGMEPPESLALALAQLRAQGIKLRDTTSFGLPGLVRVSVLPPAAQYALHNAWQHIIGKSA
ncbi:Histidinol-phosphate aminotransferase [compost metagenome]